MVRCHFFHALPTNDHLMKSVTLSTQQQPNVCWPSTRPKLGAGISQASATLLASALLWPAVAQAQSTSPSASAQLLNESRVTKDGDLNFGKVIVSNTGGTVTIAPDGNVTQSGPLLLSGTTQPASFTMTRRFLVDYPSYTAPLVSDTINLVNIADNSQTMTVTDFTTDFNRTIFFGLPAYFFTVEYPFRVGGTLNVAASQPPGEYEGSFVVNIDYD